MALRPSANVHRKFVKSFAYLKTLCVHSYLDFLWVGEWYYLSTLIFIST